MVERTHPEVQYGRKEIFKFVLDHRLALMIKFEGIDLASPKEVLGACAWAIEVWEGARAGFDLGTPEGVRAAAKAFKLPPKGESK